MHHSLVTLTRHSPFKIRIGDYKVNGWCGFEDSDGHGVCFKIYYPCAFKNDGNSPFKYASVIIRLMGGVDLKIRMDMVFVLKFITPCAFKNDGNSPIRIIPDFRYN